MVNRYKFQEGESVEDTGLVEDDFGYWVEYPDYAELQAEIETLRADVAEWKRVAIAQAELHGEAEERAERLAEALRSSADALERLDVAICAPDVHISKLVELAIAMRSALDQEGRNG